MAKLVWLDKIGKRELETCYCASWDMYEIFLDTSDSRPCMSVVLQVCRKRETALKLRNKMKQFILENGADAAINKFYPIVDRKFKKLEKFNNRKRASDEIYIYAGEGSLL